MRNTRGTRWIVRCVAVCVAASLIAAGCGDDDDEDSGATSPAAAPNSAAPNSTGVDDTTAAQPDIPATGPGWDADNVYIGVSFNGDQGTALAAVGVKGIVQGDTEAQIKAVENYYNEHGGLFGRNVVAVLDDHKSAEILQNEEASGQAGCARFTQDDKVIGVVNLSADTPTVRACYADAKLPEIVGSQRPFDDEVVTATQPYVFTALLPSWNRFAPVFVERLDAMKYFDGWDDAAGAPGDGPAKVGIFMKDDDASNRVLGLLTAELTAAGHAPASVYKYTDYSKEAGTAVLQMKDAGITHVIALDFPVIFFQIGAESQGYRPRYAVQSGNGIQLMSLLAPHAQLAGAVGLGVLPAGDTDDETPLTPGDELCRDAMAANGQTFEGRRYSQSSAFTICDGMRIILDGALAGGGLSSDAILKGIDAMGPDFEPAATFSSALSSKYPVVPGSGRDLEFAASCDCFKYVDTKEHDFPAG